MELAQAGVTIPGMSTSEFTQDAYRALLTAFKERDYTFASFPESTRLLEQAERFVIMRHDLDFDLLAAARIAEIEAEEGVKASYFILLRTDLYNPFSADGSAAVRRILELGHDLGLHFDCAAYPPESTINKLALASEREAFLLEKWFGHKIEVISYHRPNKLVLTGDPALSGQRSHTYMREFMQDIHYVSDSRGTWGYGSPTESEAFRDGRPMHVLTHPIWWAHESPTPYHTLLDYRDRKIDELETSIARSCKVYRQGRFADMTD